jgi:hypothetical protein
VGGRHACKLGLEGIVSKRKDSAYRSGRSPDWLKIRTRMRQPSRPKRNPAARAAFPKRTLIKTIHEALDRGFRDPALSLRICSGGVLVFGE